MNLLNMKIGRFPDENDLSVHFTPGVRFYFRYDDLVNHPNAVFDGVLPIKIRDEIILADWVYAIVIPAELQDEIKDAIPSDLKDKIIYVENDCKDIWKWSEKVYGVIENSRFLDESEIDWENLEKYDL